MSDSEISDEDYENEGLLKKALNVELPKDFDPKSVPQNGEEYLHHVMYERSKCKKLVTASIDCSKFKNKQTRHISVENINRNVPEHYLPTKEWQTQKVNDFIDFRKYVHLKISSEPTTSSFNEVQFMEMIKSEIPLFSQITKYDQSTKIRMLQMILKCLDNLLPGQSVDDNTGTWIYAILALLDIPLSPSCCYTIREFARKCIAVRSKLPDDAEETLYIPLNLYICLISKYFNQLDLAD